LTTRRTCEALAFTGADLRWNIVGGVPDEVAVVIVGYNSGSWLRACLDSVCREVYAGSVFYVDNASSDGSARWVIEAYPEVRIIANRRNRGFAGGNNQALSVIMQATHYRYVFLLNPDTILPVGLMSGLRHFMVAHPEYGAVGPLQVEYDADVKLGELNRLSRRDVRIGQYHVLKRWLPRLPIRVAGRYPPGVLSVYYVQGAAFFARVDLFRHVGLFDELFFAFFEEVDLCRRALWQGYRLGLLTDLRLPHASRGPEERSMRRRYYRIRNKYLFALTDPDIPARRLTCVVSQLALWDLRRVPEALRSDLSVILIPSLLAVAWLVLNAPRVIHGRRWRAKLVRSPQCPLVVTHTCPEEWTR